MNQPINLNSKQVYFTSRTDFTILDPRLQADHCTSIEPLFRKAIERGFENFCIKDDLFKYLPKDILEERGNYLNFSTVVNFPGGTSKFSDVYSLADQCESIADGIYDDTNGTVMLPSIDIVMPTCQMNEFPFTPIAMAKCGIFQDMQVRLIIESNWRREDEICDFMRGVGRANDLGGQFYVKTGTGKSGEYNPSQIKMMSEFATYLNSQYGWRVPIKVSGGIRDALQAMELIDTKWVKYLGISAPAAFAIYGELNE